MIPRPPDCLQPSLHNFAKVFLDNFLWLTKDGAKTSTNHWKKATAVTAESRNGLLGHFKPCVLGFGAVCSGMFPGALWLSLLGFLCPVYLVVYSRCLEGSLAFFSSFCSSMLKSSLKITAPEAGHSLPPNSPFASLPRASSLPRRVTPSAANATLVFPRMNSLHLQGSADCN